MTDTEHNDDSMPCGHERVECAKCNGTGCSECENGLLPWCWAGCGLANKSGGLKITFNPFAFDHETNMKFLAKGYEPLITVPLDR